MRFCFWVLLLGVFVSGCRREEKKTDCLAEAVITGHIQNREVYPRQKSLKIIIPYFEDSGMVQECEIREDGTFSFRFQPFACRDIAIETFVPYLLVRPGDSLHIEIDFQDLNKLQFSGTGAKLNTDLYAFTDGGGYYLKLKSTTEDIVKPVDVFLDYTNKEKEDRERRFREFRDKYSPEEELTVWIKKMLDAEYYKMLLEYRNLHSIYVPADTVFPAGFMDFLPQMELVFRAEVINSQTFELAQEYKCSILEREFKRHSGSLPGPDSLYNIMKNTTGHDVLSQYVLASFISGELSCNNTDVFESRQEDIENKITLAVLREPLFEIYKSKKAYQMNPKPLSDAMLWGTAGENGSAIIGGRKMSKIQDIVKRFSGKVIYINFWTHWCGPCVMEKPAEAGLQKHYSGKDVEFVSVCCSDSLAGQEVQQRFGIKGHYYFLKEGEVREMMKSFKALGYPYYLLLNREGVIVDYGSHLRPGIPATSRKIDRLLEH